MFSSCPSNALIQRSSIFYTMRYTKKPQMKLGEIAISEIKINLKSRDDIPPLLLGLQHIYTNLDLREAVFVILEENILVDIDPQNGRPGMDLWTILVLGVLRVNLNWDYDRYWTVWNLSIGSASKKKPSRKEH